MPSNNKTEQSVQELHNQSFDKDYKLLAFESMTINPVTGAVERPVSIQGNASVSVSEVTNSTVTTKTLTKTIGATSYVKTVASDSSDNSVSVSAWSIV